MNKTALVIFLLGGLLMVDTAVAQIPSSAPAGATGQCKDGSYWTNPTKQGACSGHKGIQTWYIGPGLVWVDSTTHVYHCSTDRWYGKTKAGAYLTEAAAIAEGDHADHGKPCH